jgi:hypothetical protein
MEKLPECKDTHSTARNPRAAQGNARVDTITRTIERDFGLPEGSVKLCRPDGGAIRADARIKTLRKYWEERYENI